MEGTVNRTEWLAARKALLAAEKALKQETDRLADARRALPRLAIEADYQFDGPEGRQSLAELFGPHHQLAVYHFMFPDAWEAGCTSCSFWADNLQGLAPHLAARDTKLVLVSAAPLAKLEAYRDRMGWTLPWVSEVGEAFGRDMGVRFTEAEMGSDARLYNYGSAKFPASEAPGLSIFEKDATGAIALTYQTFGRGLEAFNAAYGLMDLLPKGRDERDGPMAWLRRHDSYGA